MATADNVKAKIQGLIDAANETTGNTDADLTTAIQSLIAGFGQGGGDSYELLRKRISNTLEAIDMDMQGLSIGTRAFDSCTNLKTARLTNLGNIRGSNYMFHNCTSLEQIELCCDDSKDDRYAPNYLIYNSPLVHTVILDNFTRFEGSVFAKATSLTNMVLKSDTMIALPNTTNMFNGTPFASGGTGGTVYVPSALISEYQQATNWSTLYAAGTCNFVAIEGSEYE